MSGKAVFAINIIRDWINLSTSEISYGLLY